MSYVANLDSARTYLKVGRVERARESLLRALSGVPAEEKVASNGAYLNILSLLAKLAFGEKPKGPVEEYINEGLRVKSDHADLLFLNVLLLLEAKRFDEMLATLGIFLVSAAPDTHYMYEFAGDKALQEVFTNLLPTAYQHCSRRDELKALFTRLAAASGTPALTRALDVFATLDQRDGHEISKKAGT